MATLLSINNYFYRRDGSESIYIDHNSLLERSGWDVVPFSMHHPENPATPWSSYFVDDIEFGHGYSLAQKLVRVPKVIYSFEARRKLERLLATVTPDLAHCHSIYHHLSPSILSVLRRAGIPTVMTLHDLKIACPAYHMFDDQRLCERCKGGRLYNVARNRCIKGSFVLSSIVMLEAALHAALRSYERNVDRFIAPCRFYVDKLVEWGWKRERFIHIPNFVDTRALTPTFTPGREVLYFGRLSPEKGLLTLIQAAAVAKVPLRLVGDGPQRRDLEAEVHRCKAPVTFTGRLTGDALFDEVRRARVTVLPAEWYENAPMTVLESYALGKPVIGASIGGIPELIERERTGWLFEPRSVADLSVLLRRVSDMHDDDIAAMGQQARARVEGEFSADRYCDRILALYSSLDIAA